MKRIGPTFPKELEVAGLLGLPFSWGEDGTLSLDALTDEQRAAVLAVYEAHDPDAGPTLAEAKEADKAIIRRCCKAYIYASYSEEKQFNMNADEATRATSPPPAPETLYSHEEFLTMHAFKNEARTICNMACAEIDACQAIEEADAIMDELEYLYGLDVPPGV